MFGRHWAANKPAPKSGHKKSGRPALLRNARLGPAASEIEPSPFPGPGRAARRARQPFADAGTRNMRSNVSVIVSLGTMRALGSISHCAMTLSDISTANVISDTGR